MKKQKIDKEKRIEPFNVVLSLGDVAANLHVTERKRIDPHTLFCQMGDAAENRRFTQW